jgi:hypothetical protein
MLIRLSEIIRKNSVELMSTELVNGISYGDVGESRNEAEVSQGLVRASHPAAGFGEESVEPADRFLQFLSGVFWERGRSTKDRRVLMRNV